MVIRSIRTRLVRVGAMMLAAGSAPALAGGPLPLPATSQDFYQDGTQPGQMDMSTVLSVAQCAVCHANYDIEVEPYRPWAASMLGQSGRDPLFWAELTIANQDVTGAGQLCLRCHAPGAFVSGRVSSADDDEFTPVDFEGVSCNICHRLVDPVYKEGISPVEDESILASISLPAEGSNARYVIDPDDVRRGPYDDLPFNPHFGSPTPPVIVSPFHQSSELCWTCHDVSNPLMERQEDGTYAIDLASLDAPHPTGSHSDMFPLHRTFSEWRNSYYNTLGGVQHDGRFGGNHPTGIMNSCQDCHMPDTAGNGCTLSGQFPARPDIGQHSFSGSNTWVIDAVRSLFPDSETGLSAESAMAAKARNVAMLEAASDLEVEQVQAVLKTRIINQAGHKLPTGFPDGRRIWTNVRFLDVNDQLVGEHGAYDFTTATLDTESTTVIECVLGIDEEQAAVTGLPAGPTFHFILANEVLKDNRIPPAGFFSVFTEEDQTTPVGATFVNGQHWMDTSFPIPFGADEAVVTVYYQVTAREFIEFLRDANETDSRGQVAYDQWVAHGMSAPVVMDSVSIQLTKPADLNGDNIVDALDFLDLLAAWGPCPLPPPAQCPPDLNGDRVVDALDFLILISWWS